MTMSPVVTVKRLRARCCALGPGNSVAEEVLAIPLESAPCQPPPAGLCHAEQQSSFRNSTFLAHEERICAFVRVYEPICHKSSSSGCVDWRHAM